MKLRYTYPLYPTKNQKILLLKQAGSCRYLWNFYLAKEIAEYRLTKEYTGKGKFNWYYSNAKDLTKLKKEKTWLSEMANAPYQNTLRDLEQALKRKGGQGFPHFKKKSDGRDSFRHQNGVKVRKHGNRLGIVTIPKIGDVKFRYHRTLPNPKSASFYQDSGKWFVSFVVEVQEKTRPSKVKQVLGLDLNSKHHVWSDGVIDEKPDWTRKSLKVKKLQKDLSRKKKGKNRSKARARLARKHREVVNKRKNWLNHVSSRRAKVGTLVCLESLDVADMKKKHLSAKAIQDNGFRVLRKMLEYKTKLNGGWCQPISKWFPSTKTCSSCGDKKPMPLDIRTYDCSCGLVLDRDVNAALNIRREAIKKLNRAGTVRIKARGDTSHGITAYDGVSDVSMNREKFRDTQVLEAKFL